MMPVNGAYPVEQLIQTVRRYQETTGRRVSFEYSMVRGVNDSDVCAKQLADLIRGAEEAEAKAQIKLQSKELYGEFVNAARSVSGSVTLCPMCGASVTDGSRFCGNCGTKLC